MPKPKKSYKVKSIRLASELVPIAENSLSGATETIELGLAIVQHLVTEASLGNKTAIRLLRRFRVSPSDFNKFNKEDHQSSEDS